VADGSKGVLASPWNAVEAVEAVEAVKAVKTAKTIFYTSIYTSPHSSAATSLQTTSTLIITLKIFYQAKLTI